MLESRLLIIFALLLEAGAFVLLLSRSDAEWLLIKYLALHGVASLLLASGVWALLPRGFRNPKKLSWLLTFCLAFFVPAFGLVAILGGVLLGYFLPALFRTDPYVAVATPTFNPVPEPTGGGFRQEDLKSLLLSQDSPTELRLQGMMAVRNMPTRATGEVLRDTLADEVDDIRLLAYGILDQKEKAITRQIDRAMQLLESATLSRRFRLYRTLAELYWELIYQDLVQGAIRKLSLDQAFHYVEMALSEKADDGGMWLLRGRICMVQDQLDEAEQSFLSCRLLGLPHSRVNPWLAELALWRGDYPRVRHLMSAIADTQSSSLNQSVQYWRRP
ncbi:sulfite exporter TauE/SafE family protein [Alloalcanivorax xenomutans]|uniref:sulfite exporter TauE/SafE family protein n=1 Tax=Alloalcanivorax xenomutans TaxID=1094342 RepID=UPI003BAB53C0